MMFRNFLLVVNLFMVLGLAVDLLYFNGFDWVEFLVMMFCGVNVFWLMGDGR